MAIQLVNQPIKAEIKGIRNSQLFMFINWMQRKAKKNKMKCNFALNGFLVTFAAEINMVVVAQLVRASDCDSEGRRFEPGHPPNKSLARGAFLFDLNRSACIHSSLFMK